MYQVTFGSSVWLQVTFPFKMKKDTQSVELDEYNIVAPYMVGEEYKVWWTVYLSVYL